MDLQAEYNNPSQQQQAPADQSQGQDLDVPAAAVAQITQAIQQQDCATVMKIMTQLISAAAQGGGDPDAGMGQ